MKWFVPGWFRQFRQNWGLWQTKNGLRRPHMDPKDNAHKYGLGQYLLHMSWSPNFSGGIRQRLLFFSVLAMFNCARGSAQKARWVVGSTWCIPKKSMDHGSPLGHWDIISYRKTGWFWDRQESKNPHLNPLDCCLIHHVDGRWLNRLGVTIWLIQHLHFSLK